MRCCDLWCALGSDNDDDGGGCGVESRDFLLLVLLRGGVVAAEDGVAADFDPPMEREERMDVDII